VFETYWGQFDTDFKKILEDTKEEEVVVDRPKEDILTEILYSVRSLDKRVRAVEELEIIHSLPSSIKSKINRSQSNVLLAPIEELDLSVRTFNLLKSARINNLDEYLKMEKTGLIAVNEKIRDEIRAVINQAV
jgi:DNA-directed RNA polymerase alpha subunit